jgi:Transglutaminase-like superfamily
MLSKCLVGLIGFLLLVGYSGIGQISSQPSCRNAPFWQRYNTDKLGPYLTKNCASDQEKVRAIHCWVTKNIRYDVKKYLRLDLSLESSKKVLRRKKATCTGYSVLFAELCGAAGIESYVVSGLAKTMIFDVNRPTALSDHSWNAAKVNGKWYLIDPTWDSGYVKQYSRTIWGVLRSAITFGRYSAWRLKPRFVRATSEVYYLKSGAVFVFDHLPSLPDWQLQSERITYHKFITDSSFYFFRRPSEVSNNGFECATCGAVVQMDSTTYMLSMASSEAEFDTLNPILLARKKTYLAELAYLPEASLSEKQINLGQFIEADQSNKSLLAIWKRHKSDALKFNDHKKADHKRYHEFVWKKQVNGIRQTDKVANRLESSAKASRSRATNWSTYYSRAASKLDRITWKTKLDTNYTYSTLTDTMSTYFRDWDSLAFRMRDLSAQLNSLLDTQEVVVAEIDQWNGELLMMHRKMRTCRLQGFDDLDWPIDQLDSAITIGTSQRDQNIHTLQGAALTQTIANILKQQSDLHKEFQQLARKQIKLLKNWNAPLGQSEERSSVVAAVRTNYQKVNGSWVEINAAQSVRIFTLAKRYPGIKRAIKRERRVHRRDHYMELEAGVFRAQSIDRRYHAVYHEIKGTDKLTMRRIKRLQLDMDRLQKVQ